MSPKLSALNSAHRTLTYVVFHHEVVIADSTLSGDEAPAAVPNTDSIIPAVNRRQR
jgi:hypothetical protein